MEEKEDPDEVEERDQKEPRGWAFGVILFGTALIAVSALLWWLATTPVL